MRLGNLGCAVAIVSFGVACSATDAPQDVSEAPKVDLPKPGGGSAPGAETAQGEVLGAPKPVEELGRYRGHWDGRQLTFTRIPGAGVKPRAFIDVPDSGMSFTTDEAVAVNSACPANAGPEYFVGPASVLLGNGQTCTNGHMCALVTVENGTNRDIDRVFVQVTTITPGFEADGNPLSPVPTGYPLDDSMGLWEYGTLVSGGGGAQLQWDFPLPTCDDFTFEVKVMGTVRRVSYVNNKQTLTTQAEWINACNLPGMTRVLQNAAPGDFVSDIPMPFPFTLYDLTFDADVLPIMSISANGALGFGQITGDNLVLPDGTGVADYTMFPYWDTLSMSSEGVCYGVSGAAPNRKFVVTWVNANISQTTAAENLTFSAVLSEKSDLIQFYYNRYSNTQTACTATSTANRGGSATIGIQGLGVSNQFSFNNGTALQLHTATCPGNMEKITFTPSPGNSF
jgi:hypothetical protein